MTGEREELEARLNQALSEEDRLVDARKAIRKALREIRAEKARLKRLLKKGRPTGKQGGGTQSNDGWQDMREVERMQEKATLIPILSG